MIEITNSFLAWAYAGRRELLEDIYNDKIADKNKMFIEFTRHTPVMITNGPAGLNGSVKGFGFVPKQEFVSEMLARLVDIIKLGEKASDEVRLKTLIDTVYCKDVEHKLDFSKLVSLELAKKHTWENVSAGKGSCTLVYYQPPMISFEVRGSVEVHSDDQYSMFANAIHDIYHSKNTQIASKPAYIMTIEEIFDNSVQGFGKKIY